MIETIISSIIFILTIFFTGVNYGKKRAKNKSDESTLDEIEKIQQDYIKRSNDNRDIRTKRLSQYTED
ncbi:MAG: hypothetical protein ULS35scaffold63_43 [Phage 33_17]|nr:MAG: hypothetical protein ULS35scaffold63_43 [Phage 33_17]